MNNIHNLFRHISNINGIVLAEKNNNIGGNYLSPPIMCDLDLASICNLECIWCCQANWRFSKETGLMQEDVLEKLPFFYRNWGGKSIRISGEGEPTIHPMLNECINSFYLQKISVGLITNGTLLYKIPISNFNKLTYLGISIDASDRDSWAHNKNSKPELFDNIIEGVKKVRKKFPDLDISLKYLMFNEASLSYDEFSNFEKQNHPNFIGDANCTREKIFQFENLCKDLKVNSIIKTAYEAGYPNMYNFTKCRATPLGGVFGADLKFHLCCDARGKYILTDNFAKDNWKELPSLWGSKKHLDLINSIEPKSCLGCAKKTHNEILSNIVLTSDKTKDLQVDFI
jgi:organic radical activating enzyme